MSSKAEETIKLAKQMALLSAGIKRHIQDGAKVSEAMNKAGIDPLTAMNGCIGFFAYSNVVAAVGSTDPTKDSQTRVPAASREQYLTFCAQVYDMLVMYQQGMRARAGETNEQRRPIRKPKKDDPR